MIIIVASIVRVKVKVIPHTFVRRGVSVREDTYAEPSACEVGWAVSERSVRASSRARAVDLPHRRHAL